MFVLLLGRACERAFVFRWSPLYPTLPPTQVDSRPRLYFCGRGRSLSLHPVRAVTRWLLTCVLRWSAQKLFVGERAYGALRKIVGV